MGSGCCCSGIGVSVLMLLVLGVSSYETGLRAVGGDRIGVGKREKGGMQEY